VGGDHDLAWIGATIYLIDQLCCGLAACFGIAGINGDDLRVEKFHERRIPHTRQLQIINALFL
jgi:hypothetical protein